MQITIDLKKQEYPAFDVDVVEHLELGNKNFLYGKNGSGKTSLTNLIRKDYENSTDYNLNVFAGIDNLLVDNKLNAIVLGEENIEIKNKLDNLESELDDITTNQNEMEKRLKGLDWQVEYTDLEIEKSDECIELEKREGEMSTQTTAINNFYTESARKIKEHSNPQISSTNYNRRDFKAEILEAQQLDENILDGMLQSLKEEPKEELDQVQINQFDFKYILDLVNNVVTQTLEEIIVIEELKDSPEKQKFAQEGRDLHTTGELCAFCGNKYSLEREEILNKYFSSDDINKLQAEINKIEKELEFFREKIRNVEILEVDKFYNHLRSEVIIYNTITQENITKSIEFIDTLKEALQNKKLDLFSKKRALNVEIPNDFTKKNEKINSIIEEQNSFTKNFENEQAQKKDQIRLHFIYIYINEKSDYKEGWKGYDLEQYELEKCEAAYEQQRENIEQEIKKLIGSEEQPEKETLNYFKEKKKELEEIKKSLIKDSKNTRVLAETINDKLSSFGKNEIRLEVENNRGQLEHYMIKDTNDNIRDISKISTGEQNIIAFLYFIGKVKSDSEEMKNKKHIVVFDDPMTSNDDTMQYLIITELQKLYRGSNKILNNQKDIFICLTHNVHFYLNVQPQGNFKDKNGRTKYDKNYFYWLSNGVFKHITSEKEDISTHYEGLWMELKELFNHNHLNTMLNSMRRIIETYVHFNKIHPNKFYNEKEAHKKIFDVNSHSVDDLSADIIGKSREDLLNMFEVLFIENDAEEHFKSYWKP